MPAKKYFCKEDINKLEFLIEEEIECLEFSGNLNTKSKFICKKCGYIWESYSSNVVISKRGCPNCNKHANIKSKEEADVYLKIRNMNHIECVEYGGTVSSNSVFRCKKCGETFKYTLDYISHTNNKDVCPYCGKNKRRKSIEEINKILKNNCLDVECIKYNGMKSISVFKCLKCGNIIEFQLKKINRTSYCCKFCNEKSEKNKYDSKNMHKTYNIESVNEYLKDNNISLVCIEYAGRTHDKSKFKCLIHGIEFVCPFNKVKSDNQRCPRCSSSKGENLIDEYLSSKMIKYVRQKTFDGCVNKGLLKFDFYIPKLNLAIEYDGEQHFKPVEQFGGQEAFELLKINDEIKNKFCTENNIELLRISYKNIKKISEILDRYLK